MVFLNYILVAVALAMDAFTVAVGGGAGLCCCGKAREELVYIKHNY